MRSLVITCTVVSLIAVAVALFVSRPAEIAPAVAFDEVSPAGKGFSIVDPPLSEISTRIESQSVRQSEVALDAIPVRDGDALRRQREMYLRAGTPGQLGIIEDVTLELRQLARGDIVKLWEAAKYKRASGVLALGSWAELENAIASAAQNDPVMRQELEAVASDALTLADDINRLAEESFSTLVGLEEWDTSVAHDTTKWREDNGFQGTAGALRFGSAVALGGRGYRVYFDSIHHPNIDHRILMLRERLMRIGPSGK